MITVVYPFVLFTILPLTLFLLYLMLTNKDKISRVFSQETLEKLRTKDSGFSQKSRNVFFAVAIVLMVLALSRPLLLKDYEDYKPTYNILIAIDTSQSMFSKDIYPNRFEFSKQKVIELLKNSNGINYSIALFNKDMFLISPMSVNYKVLIDKLKNLNIQPSSTRANYLNLFKKSDYFFPKKSQKTIIIFSDGDNASEYVQEKELLKQSDIKVLVAGVGTQKGAPLIDEKSQVLSKQWSRFNKNIYALSSEKSGLELTWATDLNKIVNTFINKAAIDKTGLSYDKFDKIELFKPLLGIALILIFIASFSFPRFSTLFLLMFLFCYPQQTKASLTDFKVIQKAQSAYENQEYEQAVKHFLQLRTSAQREYNIANSYYRLKDYKRAIEYYKKIQTGKKELSHKKFHNLGNSYFMVQEYKKAVESYEKALKFANDQDTLANLKEAKKKLQNQDKEKVSKSGDKNSDDAKKIDKKQNEKLIQSEKEKNDTHKQKQNTAEKTMQSIETKYKKYDRLLHKPKTQIIKIEEEN